jgi:hypothetical protein
MKLQMKMLLVLLFMVSEVGRAETYEDLQEIIRTNHVNTIAELLPHLSSQMKRQFTLVMKSRSLQEGSPEYPRVILYGDNAKLLLAFNGDSKQLGYDRMEVIQYRDQEAKFEFFEIQFPEKDDEGKPLNNLSEPKFSSANQAKCLSCHTSDPRPNWEHYFTWPGVFMGADDSANTPEDASFPSAEKFLQTAPALYAKHPRYKNLERLVEGYNSTDSGDGRATNKNINMTERVGVLNYRRVARILRQDPYYQNYKYMIALSISCLPGDWEQGTPQDFPSFKPRVDGFGQTDFSGVYRRRGLSMADLYGNFKSPAPFFTLPSYLTNRLVEPIVYDDPDLAPYFTVREDQYNGLTTPVAEPKDCKGLAEASLKALSSNVPNPKDEIDARLASQPKIVKRCMSCHTGELTLVGPHIPFDNLIRLKSHLSAQNYEHGSFKDELLYRISESAAPKNRMPPEGISEKERSQLQDFIQRL